jgi:hypothetical protein
MRLSRELLLELEICRLHQDGAVGKDDHGGPPGATDESGLLGLRRIVLHVATIPRWAKPKPTEKTY